MSSCGIYPNAALNALVFLYDSVLQKPLGGLAGLKRIQRRHRVPVVLSREEVKAVLEQMTGVPRLMAELMYGAGLRVSVHGPVAVNHGRCATESALAEYLPPTCRH